MLGQRNGFEAIQGQVFYEVVKTLRATFVARRSITLSAIGMVCPTKNITPGVTTFTATLAPLPSTVYFVRYRATALAVLLGRDENFEEAPGNAGVALCFDSGTNL